MILPYSDELQEKYRVIKEFIHEISVLNGRKEKLMEIYYWLLTYPYLSQAEILGLTGYSAGTVSESLNTLMEVSAVEIRSRKNSSVSEYFLTITKLSFDYSLSSRQEPLVKRVNSFMKNLMHNMQNVPPAKSDLLMLENLQDFTDYFLWVSDLSIKRDLLYRPSTLQKLQVRVLNPDFSPRFVEFEKKFIEFFVKEQLFEERTDKNSIVMGLFITRGTLTISEITTLVPFSIGTVSSCVHYLESLHFIQKNQGKFGYSLFSFGVGWLSYREYVYLQMEGWHNIFDRMKQDLELSLQEYHFIPQVGPFLVFLNRLLNSFDRTRCYYEENAPLWKVIHDYMLNHPEHYPPD